MSPRDRIRASDGFTIVEVIVAMAISLAMLIAVGGTLVKGIFNSAGHQRQAAGLTIAEREVETVRQVAARYGFSQVALSSAPSGGTPTLVGNPDNPTDFLTGSGSFRVMESFHDTTRGVLATEPVLTGGQIAPVTTGVTSGGVTATVYRFVTQHAEPCTTVGTCDGDSRRIVIAVVPTNNPTNELQTHKPVYLQAIIDSPTPSDEPVTPGRGLRIGANIS